MARRPPSADELKRNDAQLAKNSAVSVLRKDAAKRSSGELDTLFRWVQGLKIKFFQDNKEEVIRDLSKAMRYEKVDTHAELFKQGDVADRFYLILSGSVSLWVTNTSDDNEYPDPKKTPTIMRLKQLATSDSIRTPSLKRLKAERAVHHSGGGGGGGGGDGGDGGGGDGSGGDSDGAGGGGVGGGAAAGASSDAKQQHQRKKKKLGLGLSVGGGGGGGGGDGSGGGRRVKVGASPSRSRGRARIGVTKRVSATEAAARAAEQTGERNIEAEMGGIARLQPGEAADGDGLRVDTEQAKRNDRSRIRVQTNPSSPKMGKIKQTIDMKKESEATFIGIFVAGGPKTTFGELGLISEATRSATIRAEEPSEFLTIEKADFDRVLKQRYREAMAAKVASMRTFKIFANMSETHLNKISLHTQRREATANQLLGKAGTTATHVFFVLRGKVRLLAQKRDGDDGGGDDAAASRAAAISAAVKSGLSEEQATAAADAAAAASASPSSGVRKGGSSGSLSRPGSAKRNSLKVSQKAEQEVVRTVGAGDMFGQEALSENERKYAYTARASDDGCEVFAIAREDILRRVRADVVQGFLPEIKEEQQPKK